ncbi:MAG: DNA repair protein RecN [Bacteroidaceae bacterium]|nr:DNA repair protein RecN [Bacteroidaceae bacterium]
MLTHISIRNFALIEKAEIDFSAGFSVITGETGHGKSVFLGAVAMMLGQRSDTKLVREGADKCVIEGHFNVSGFGLEAFFEENDLDYDTECIIRRELSASGRSRAFVNDVPVTVSLLKDLGSRLIDIHSQHQNLLLGNSGYQLGVLDVLAGSRAQLLEYKGAYDEYMALKEKLSRLKKALDESRRDEDWLRFQLNELEGASLKEGELEELELELQELSHAEDIQAALYGACSAVDGDERSMLQLLKEAASTLSRISEHYAPAGELSERLESNYIELKDCCAEMRQRAERVQFAPERLNIVEERVSQLYALVKKHRVEDVSGLIALMNEYRQRLDGIVGGDDEIVELERELGRLAGNLEKLAAGLTSVRKDSALELQDKIMAILVNLGMPMIRFEVGFKQLQNFSPMGCDDVTFLFSANSSSAPQPLCDVASGGEMARVMLALKSLVASSTKQPTLIFDEVDTGVSGVLAERMGRIMQQMAGGLCQVLSITHLPQVAAQGAAHYKVYKEETEKGTVTNIIRLEAEERVREIAQMMSGEVLAEAALDNARQLLSSSAAAMQ